MRVAAERLLAGLVVWLIHSVAIFLGLLLLLGYSSRWHIGWWIGAKQEAIYTGTLMVWPYLTIALTPVSLLLLVLAVVSGIGGAVAQQIVWYEKTRGRGTLAEIRQQSRSQGLATGTPAARAKARSPIVEE